MSFTFIRGTSIRVTELLSSFREFEIFSITIIKKEFLLDKNTVHIFLFMSKFFAIRVTKLLFSFSEFEIFPN